jgi:flagellar motility protein MotE (MotC chaperone)
MTNTNRKYESLKLRSLTTSLQRDSRRKKSDLRQLLYRLISFIVVAGFLMVGSAMLDDNQVAKYLFSKSYAKTEEKKTSVKEAEKDLLNSLQTRKEELDRKESLIKENEKRLEQEKKEIEVKLEDVKKIRDEIAKKMDEKVKVEEDRMSKMVSSFENMKPASAASIFENMDVNLVVKIMDRMKSKNVAMIMDKMSQDKATNITTSFALLKDRGAGQVAK